jgi:signal transduction histidine kinase
LMIDWFSRRRFWKKDLFVHTQNRLTVQYSILLMVFLTLFIGIVYVLVDIGISYEQKRQLRMITEQEVKLMEEALRDGVLSQEEYDNLNRIRESRNQFFYYVVDANGQLLFGDEFIPRAKPQILELVRGWIPAANEVRYGTVTVPPPPRRGKPLPPMDGRLELMMTGRPVFQGVQMKGIFYTGIDISFTNHLLKRLLTILTALGILFLGIALLLSYFMSKRAMIPIRRSFQRQREFVADASHELRTPLSILQSSLDVFEMEEGEQLSAFGRTVLFNMKDEVRRMTKLVSDLLTLARSDSGHPDLQCEYADVVPAVQQMIRSTQTVAASKKIALKLDAPPAVMVYGDHERIKQLLYILLDNAIKYTPGGGEIQVTLSVDETENPPVLCLSVRDTGIGIPPEEQNRIFDRFYRVDKNRSKQMGGTGLGLAIAKWIVEAHHGTITVVSSPGNGSTFTAKIPLHTPKA